MADIKERDRGLRLVDDAVAQGSTTLTSSAVRQRLGLTPQGTSNLLRRLTEEGILERIRPGSYAIRGFGMLGTHAAAESLPVAVAAAFGSTLHRIGYRSALDELELLTHPANCPGGVRTPRAYSVTLRSTAQDGDRAGARDPHWRGACGSLVDVWDRARAARRRRASGARRWRANACGGARRGGAPGGPRTSRRLGGRSWMERRAASHRIDCRPPQYRPACWSTPPSEATNCGCRSRSQAHEAQRVARSRLVGALGS